MSDATPVVESAAQAAARTSSEPKTQPKNIKAAAGSAGAAGPSSPASTSPASTSPTAATPKAKKPNAKAAAKAAKAERRAGRPQAAQQAVAPPPPVTEEAPPSSSTDPLQLFLHLDIPTASSALSHSAKASTAALHPSIIKLALLYADFAIVGANARCLAMLQAFKDLLVSYSPPPQTHIARHFPAHYLNPHIAHLVRARPLAVSMGTAIRFLKYEVSLVGADTSLEDARTHLLGRIDTFIRDRILLAGRVIEGHASSKIRDGSTVLTYARSSVVERVLLAARRQGRDFRVVVVDSRPLLEGRNLLATLAAAGIPTTYVLLPQLGSAPRADLCLLGTHAVLSNGSMYARAGTAMVAMVMKETGVPVVCCCETYKFSERVMLDSIVGNEMTLSESLVADLPGAPPPALSPLSLLYDVSRPEDVTAVVTEAGFIPVQSVPVIIREYKPLM